MQKQKNQNNSQLYIISFYKENEYLNFQLYKYNKESSQVKLCSIIYFLNIFLGTQKYINLFDEQYKVSMYQIEEFLIIFIQLFDK